LSSTRILSGYDGDVKWIPVRAAAKILGVSRQRVQKLCRTDQLVSIVIESTRLVSLRTVEMRRDNKRKEVV
jgi:hypothetical protein